MRFLACFFIGFISVASLSNAAVVQRRTNRNTEEILVPVAIIQDGEEIKQPDDFKNIVSLPEETILKTAVIVKDNIATVKAEQNLETAEAVVQAQRRIDEAVVEEEIKEAVQEEQDKEIIKALVEENQLQAQQPQVVSVIKIENNADLTEADKEAEQTEKALDYKSETVSTQTPNQVVVVLEQDKESAIDEAAGQQPEVAVRQATQATPTQTTTQQNLVQFIQSSPLGQFFNQITGQTTQSQLASDEGAPAAPGLFNPVTAVQNAAQSVVNSTTQAFQGLQQFASNLGTQFQSTLSGLTGQQQDQTVNGVTTARPPGPIVQLVNSFINPAQPAPTSQGPLQGLFNIFQGNTRPQGAAPPAASGTPEPQPAKEPDTPTSAADESAALTSNDEINNEVRDSAESNDSLEESAQPGELIVVNDDATAQTENEELPEAL